MGASWERPRAGAAARRLSPGACGPRSKDSTAPAGGPGADVTILPWAGLARRPVKDLSDSFVSWLLTVGIPLDYISCQLGHADTEVRERHCARWAPEGYVEPMRLGPGEVPADLLAQLPAGGVESQPASDPTWVAGHRREKLRFRQVR